MCVLQLHDLPQHWLHFKTKQQETSQKPSNVNSFSSPWQLLLLDSFRMQGSWSCSGEESGWTLEVKLLPSANLLPLLLRVSSLLLYLNWDFYTWNTYFTNTHGFSAHLFLPQCWHHFIASMTQKFKARGHGCGEAKRHTLNLANRMETCSCNLFPLTVKDFIPESFQSLSEMGWGRPILKSQRNILISRITELIHAAHSHRLCQLIWLSFLITHLL